MEVKLSKEELREYNLQAMQLIYDNCYLVNNSIVCYNNSDKDIITVFDDTCTQRFKYIANEFTANSEYVSRIPSKFNWLWAETGNNTDLRRFMLYKVYQDDSNFHLYDAETCKEYILNEKAVNEFVFSTFDYSFADIINNVLIIGIHRKVIVFHIEGNILNVTKIINTLDFNPTSIEIQDTSFNNREGLIEVTYYKGYMGDGYGRNRYDSLVSSIIDKDTGEVIVEEKVRSKFFPNYVATIKIRPKRQMLVINNQVIENLNTFSNIVPIQGNKNIIGIQDMDCYGLVRLDGKILLNINYDELSYIDNNTVLARIYAKDYIDSNNNIVDGAIVNIVTGNIIRGIINYFKPIKQLPLAFIQDANNETKELFMETYLENSINAITKYFNVYYNKKYTNINVIYYGKSINDFVLVDRQFNSIKIDILSELNEYGWEKLECTEKE